MASTSEKGHAKNIANANLLNTYIAQLGAMYNPSNPQLALANLQSLYVNSFTHQETVNALLAPYSTAVDNREAIFAPISKKITKLHKAYKATAGVTQANLEGFMSISSKIKGTKKTATITPDATTPTSAVHSTSQLSYDQRTNNYDALIALLQNTPNYLPNEPEYQVATLQAEKIQMFQATQNVANTLVALNNARNTRNNSLYLANDNLIDSCNKAKDYLFTILDTKSTQFKAISKIKFKTL